MRCISLFSGAGGLDTGLEAAGFDIVASIERDRDCCKTLDANGRRNVICSDISDVDFKAIAGVEAIDVVVGGPPCQPFSKSALWTHAGTRGLSDPRSGTIADFLGAIKVLRPRAFILENVEGFSRLGGLDVVKVQLSELQESGLFYSLSCAILNSADFGVPQKRRRFFAVGILGGDPYLFPEPTHGCKDYPYTTAWDACVAASPRIKGESLEIRGRWSDLLQSIPPGQNYLWHTARGGGIPLFGWRTRFWSFLYKLDPQQPSPTIVASPSQNSGPFHWQNRLLSTPELAAIQTFPSGYVFYGERVSRQRQIGNAVPPLLAEKVGRSLLNQLGGTPPVALTLELLRTKRRPQRTLVKPVPTRHLGAVGEYPDHPGSGQGPRPRPASLVKPQ